MNRSNEGTVTLQEHKVNEKGNKEELIQKLIKSKEEAEKAKASAFLDKPLYQRKVFSVIKKATSAPI